jgi:hypothetical protein
MLAPGIGVGAVPPQDYQELERAGAEAIFPPGTVICGYTGFGRGDDGQSQQRGGNCKNRRFWQDQRPPGANPSYVGRPVAGFRSPWLVKKQRDVIYITSRAQRLR